MNDIEASNLFKKQTEEIASLRETIAYKNTEIMTLTRLLRDEKNRSQIAEHKLKKVYK